MNCYCISKTNYTCFDCERVSVWDSLSELEQSKLRTLNNLVMSDSKEATKSEKFKQLAIWSMEKGITLADYQE